MPIAENYDFRVKMHWESYDTQLYSAKLMRHTEKHETEFSHGATAGSIVSEFAVAILANGGYDLIKNQALYLLKRRKRAEAAGRDAPPARLSIDIDFPDFHLEDISVNIARNIDISIFSKDATYEIEIEGEDDVDEVEKIVEAAKEIEERR